MGELIFLSYSSCDRARVAEVVPWLKRRGLDVWIDRERIQPPDGVVLAVSEGIRTSRFAVIFLSRAYLDGPFTRTELETLIHAVIYSDDRRVLVVRLDPDCALPPLLAHRLFKDWDDPESVAETIARFVRRGSSAAVYEPPVFEYLPSRPRQWAEVEPHDLECLGRELLDRVDELRRITSPLVRMDAMSCLPVKYALAVRTSLLGDRGQTAELRSTLSRLDTVRRLAATLATELEASPADARRCMVEIELEDKQTRAAVLWTKLRSQLEALAPDVEVRLPASW